MAVKVVACAISGSCCFPGSLPCIQQAHIKLLLFFRFSPVFFFFFSFFIIGGGCLSQERRKVEKKLFFPSLQCKSQFHLHQQVRFNIPNVWMCLFFNSPFNLLQHLLTSLVNNEFNKIFNTYLVYLCTSYRILPYFLVCLGFLKKLSFKTISYCILFRSITYAALNNSFHYFLIFFLFQEFGVFSLNFWDFYFLFS